MDKIFVENLIVRGKHGVSAEERARDQRFSIDIIAQLDAKRAATSDTLEDTLSYSHMRTLTKDIVEKGSYKLMETIADTIAQRVLEDTRVANVSVTVRKMDVYPDCTPGVTIERTR